MRGSHPALSAARALTSPHKEAYENFSLEISYQQGLRGPHEWGAWAAVRETLLK